MVDTDFPCYVVFADSGQIHVIYILQLSYHNFLLTKACTFPLCPSCTHMTYEWKNVDKSH